MKKYYSEGKLLERISYVSRQESKTKNIFGDEILVHETFPFNPDSKTAPGTAKSWASQRPWNFTTGKYDDPKFVPTVVDLTNDPFEVTIIDLQVRSQGGRAYKVIDSESRLFDLREDQLLEALKLGGVQPGGKINGKFVWGILSSQVRMVYVGGEMHTGMVEKLETDRERDLARSNGDAPKASTFVVGNVYKKRDDSEYVFVGRVRTAGSKKKLFAFTELPTPPYAHSEETIEKYATMYRDGTYAETLRADTVIAKKWDTMTWLERCEWYWKKNNYNASIMLMSTPKFDSDEGAGAKDVAELLRKNDGNHRYVDGFRNDLVIDRWLKKTGNDLNRYWPQPYGYFTSDAQRIAFDKQRQEDNKTAFNEFKAELVWD